MSVVSGFDCKVAVEPPEALQCYCPICLLILREPYKVTCCEKSYCSVCIQQLQEEDEPCPSCKQDNFKSFQNIDLQQPLYELKVFCSYKEEGCGWQGELGQLDQHLNENPDEDSLSVGCAYANIKCFLCDKLCSRNLLDDHQTLKCLKRPFTCSMCDDYNSTYDDVLTNHVPECKCRPVECPNSCGASNLQHQHLEEHVSSQCPLTLVECEFSDAGCDAKVYRRDLPSHLSTNMVSHMSLLARENKKLASQNEKQSQQLKAQSDAITLSLESQNELLKKVKLLSNEVKMGRNNNFIETFSKVLPRQFKCHFSDCMNNRWESEPFYSHPGGHKLRLAVSLTPSANEDQYRLEIQYDFLVSEFVVQGPKFLNIRTKLVNQENKEESISVSHTISDSKSPEQVFPISIPQEMVCPFLSNGHLMEFIANMENDPDFFSKSCQF